VNPNNPGYKATVGEIIYEFVKNITGNSALMITGMLLDLPIDEVIKYLKDYSKL
jgi:hypothetical protein